jgi:hypothetical protein
VITGVQLGHLIGKVPADVARMVGARTREEIEQLLKQRGVELAAQAERQKAEDAEIAAMAEETQRMMDEQKAAGHVDAPF